MTRKLSRIFILCSISIIASFGIYKIVEACADFEISDDDIHSVYSQDIVGKTPYAPYLYTAFDMYSSAATAWDSTIAEPDNISDWKAEIGGNATKEDITQLVYASTGKDISELIKHFMNNKPALSEKWKNNTAVLQLKSAKDVETLEYLAYAKQCEPHVTGDYNEWEPVERNKAAMNALIASGQKAYDKIKKESLKQRYAYQVVRLAHYSNQYDQALKLYEKMFGKVQRKSYLSYKAYAIKGGAHFRKGNKSQSRFIFSRLFDEFPSERELAMRNFNWATYEGSRNEGIEYCKTPHEKATIWFMDAYFRDHSEYLPFMESIYREQPGSEYLDILLARYIALMQHNALPYRYSGSGAIDIMDSLKNVKTPEEKFIEKCVSENKVKRPYLWEFSLGYISYLKKNTNDARKHFNNARGLAAGDQLVNDQVHVMEMLLKLQEAPKIDAKFERAIVSDLQWLASYKGPLKTTDARSFIMLQMSDKYKAQGNSLRSALCLSASYGGKDLHYNPNYEPIDELIAFKKKKKKTEFEAILDTSFTVSLSKLHEIKGTVFLGKHQFEEAVKELEMCDAKELDSLPADPFFIRIRDCHDCDFELPKATVYNKLSLAKKMVQMQKDVTKKQDAKTYFDIANGYYNLTYYGNSWMAMAYGRWHWHTPWDTYDVNELRPAQYFNCMRALEYYRKTMEAAGSDRELAAKACYMASKCEQNEFYNLGKLDDEKTLNETYRNYFRELKEKYSDTKYYQEVIRECSYFREFVKK